MSEPILVVRVNTDRHDFAPQYAAIVLSEDLLRSIVTRQAMFDAAREEDAQLYALDFFDHAPVFFGDPVEGASAVVGYDLEQLDNLIGVGDEFAEHALLSTDTLLDEGVVTNVQACTMVVTDTDVYWTAYPKHTDLRVGTARLTRSGIKKWREEGAEAAFGSSSA